MKQLLFFLIVFSPLLSNAQIHLGISEKEIRDLHYDKTFEVGFDDEGNKYISTLMDYGTFIYFIDQESGLCDVCVQQVDEKAPLKEQVEVYNNKYVVVSDTAWKAYVQGLRVIDINLYYEDDTYLFYYNTSSGFDVVFAIPETDSGR